MLAGFKQFILRGNVVDLAVGVVIGASFQGLIAALVKDFITPLLGLISGGPDFSFYKIHVGNSAFLVGDFLSVLIAFLIDAAVVYFFVVLPMTHFVQRVKKEKPVDPTEKRCVDCLSLIPKEARKCKFCASLQSAEEKK